MLAAAIPVALLLVAFLVFPRDGDRTVTAHFDRAVAVYPGTDLRVMGVQVGEVTSVVPDGNSVRVEMTYEDKYKLPAGASAAVVTPTLVADRYVQVFPAYGKGAVMPDGGDIPLARTQTPIELDRMFKALDDLSVTLGPKAGSTDGALDNLLTAGTKALDGNGELGSKTIRNLSAAAETFANNRGPLFDNVRSLAEITDTLAANDATVEAFLEHLTSVSGQLEGEREELRTVLASLARVLGIVKGFVRENREALGTDIELLASLLERVDNQKDNLGLVVQKGSSALSNLAIAFESGTGTYGSRIQVLPDDHVPPVRVPGEATGQRSSGGLQRPQGAAQARARRTIGQRSRRRRSGRIREGPDRAGDHPGSGAQRPEGRLALPVRSARGWQEMTSLRMKRRIVAAMALALLLSGCSSFDGVYDLPLPGNKVSKDDGFLVSADFADALNVVPRSSVMVADVPIGQVEEVTRVGWHARVTMRIRKDVELPDDAEATIRQTSLLGEKFVALAPPSSPDSGDASAGSGRLGAGDVIPMDRTGRNPEVEEVLGALSFLLSGGGIGQLQTITFELNEMMEGRTGKIRDVLGRVNTLVKTLDSQKGEIVQAMKSINGLSKTLVAEKKTIGEALDAAGPAIKVLRQQHDELVDMLVELDKLGVVGTRVVREIKDDLIAELRHLEPVLRNVADAGRRAVVGTELPRLRDARPGPRRGSRLPVPGRRGRHHPRRLRERHLQDADQAHADQRGRAVADVARGHRDAVPLDTTRPDLLFGRRHGRSRSARWSRFIAAVRRDGQPGGGMPPSAGLSSPNPPRRPCPSRRTS